MTQNLAELSFSFHAVKRCLERGISEKNVIDTVLLGNPVVDTGERAVFALGRMRVVIAEGILVVTAYRERKRNPKRRIQKKRKQIRQIRRGLK